MARTLLAIPVYNEAKNVERVLGRVLEYVPDVLVIDDGSSDATPSLLAQFPVEVIRHAHNRGYGRSLMDAFRWAAVDRFDWRAASSSRSPSTAPDWRSSKLGLRLQRRLKKPSTTRKNTTLRRNLPGEW